MSGSPANPTGHATPHATPHAIWALGSLCALHQKPFDAGLLLHEYPAPCDDAWLTRSSRALGFRSRRVALKPGDCARLPLPLLVLLHRPAPAPGSADSAAPEPSPTLALVTAANAEHVVLFEPGSTEPQTLSHAELQALLLPAADGAAPPLAHQSRSLLRWPGWPHRRLQPQAWLFAPEAPPTPAADSGSGLDAAAGSAASATAQSNGASGTQPFGFAWFIPELLRHKAVWRDVLLASLALQLITLTTPLLTQAIIDKVVVHRTQSTLIAIGLAMGLMVLLGALLGWARQFLVLHTGNRVDAVLGAAVWEHLLRLPLRYFEHRPSGVVAARLHAVENIREFVSGAAIGLVLDLPFLLLCVALMLWYSVTLSAIAVGVLAVIALASLAMAPVFQRQLNEQFLLGARNQAFVTEHMAGFETVKTLQMEPQLRRTYGGYLATLLASSFQTRQVANTYNSVATALQQTMTLAVLVVGAWLVMQSATDPNQAGGFTVGMLVAFQMFAGKLSEPVMRLVGLWTQFQQASTSVQRLGDVMNAPPEPYTLSPRRQANPNCSIQVQDLAFRYGPDRPLLYEHLNLTLQPGQAIALMGPSGSGKSTLAKLLLGFYTPTAGRIVLGGVDTRTLSANELRAHFGVVPQETVLFSGSVRHNLQLGNPQASFEQVVQAARWAGVHEVIEQLPQGYDTELGERGMGLSGGQRQRLAIARALLKRPQVLIFDEATSALDGPTAEAFAQTVNHLRQQLQGRISMIFITHALPAGLLVDGVVRLGQRLISQATETRGNAV